MDGISNFSLDGKVALVTGASRGLGQAIALGFAKAGADLALLARSKELETTAAECRKRGARALTLRQSLPECEAEAEEALEKVFSHFGQLSILVNVAGVNYRSPAEKFSLQDWDRIMQVNLRSVFLLCRGAGERMLRAGEGKIINIASLLSFFGGKNVVAYAASKGAVVQITRSLANEWASRGVNVNAIAPGYIETEMTRPLLQDPERNREILDRIPAGRWGRPEDIVGAAVFLASEASCYVNGHVLMVDGGWMAR